MHKRDKQLVRNVTSLKTHPEIYVLLKKKNQQTFLSMLIHVSPSSLFQPFCPIHQYIKNRGEEERPPTETSTPNITTKRGKAIHDLQSCFMLHSVMLFVELGFRKWHFCELRVSPMNSSKHKY